MFTEAIYCSISPLHNFSSPFSILYNMLHGTLLQEVFQCFLYFYIINILWVYTISSIMPFYFYTPIYLHHLFKRNNDFLMKFSIIHAIVDITMDKHYCPITESDSKVLV